ncbi:hypothetical protein A5728_02320 [Kocuria sp. ICS0012]|nr:hypothetical protein A5728_02320 [Kocuria sp. ICS0012]
MMAVMLTGQRIMLIITQWLVYPLILILLGVTLYLIPAWNFSAFRGVPTPGEFLMSVWLVIPVLVFAFNHSPAISQFSVAMKHEYGSRASGPPRRRSSSSRVGSRPWPPRASCR